MSNWQLIVLPLLVTAVSSCSNEAHSKIELKIGQPITTSSNGLRVRFDGNQRLEVGSQAVNAKPPSTLYFSRGGSWLLNFGDGSGQVYAAELHAMGSSAVSDTALRNELAHIARSKNCDVRADEISILFIRWIDETSFEARSENWSRREPCAVMERTWRVGLENGRLRIQNSLELQ